MKSSRIRCAYLFGELANPNLLPPEEIEATIQRANEYGDSIKAKGQKVQMGGIYHKAFLERWGVQ
jgi:hypothetical protein